MLFIVATPIGNIKDITYRALETLDKADFILCEDTRVTGQLLKIYKDKGFLKRKDKPKLISYYEENEQQRIPQVLKLLKNNAQIALVTNSGTPAISDPGFKLTRACQQNNLKVTPVPGPSALVAALSASGLPPDKFIFLGFLPKKQAKKEKILKSCLQIRTQKPFRHITFILYESPHRLEKSLNDIYKIFANTKITIASELTKKFEKIEKHDLKTLVNSPKKIKGEIVLLF